MSTPSAATATTSTCIKRDACVCHFLFLRTGMYWRALRMRVRAHGEKPGCAPAKCLGSRCSAAHDLPRIASLPALYRAIERKAVFERRSFFGSTCLRRGVSLGAIVSATEQTQYLNRWRSLQELYLYLQGRAMSIFLDLTACHALK